jgi:hypothetical protein
MAVPPNVRAAALLLVALALVLSGTWLATSTASSPPSPASPEAQRDGTLIKYHGTEAKATLPLRANRLPGAPSEFRAFVKAELHDLWDDLGHTVGCKSSPLLTVDALRTDGFAIGGVNTIPRRHCPDAGGGYAAIWAVRHGAWKEVIGTQEVVDCRRLERFDIPSEIGVHQCYEGGELVPYDHP